VVPVRAENIVMKAAPADVHVMNRRRLVRWLRRRVPTLDRASVEAIYEAARRSTTWQQA
jgi:type III secretion system FlhB-like substrate exporter